MYMAVQLLALRLIAHAIEGSDSIRIHRIDFSAAMSAQDDADIQLFNGSVHASLILSSIRLIRLPSHRFPDQLQDWTSSSRFKLFCFQCTSNYAVFIIISCD